MKGGVQGPLARSGNTPPPDLIYRPPPDDGLVILHHDDDMVVLSKPSGLLSVPGNKPHLQDCMEARVQAEFPTATTIHRLDRPTSGVCVMALNREAHRRLGKQFELRQTRKTYRAVVSGEPAEDRGTIEQPLRTDWYNRPKQMVDNCLGREAITHWRVDERLGDQAIMTLNPVTGRSHQLRVHLQWLGHPILGDEFYAPPTVLAKSDRLLLHAESLEITHPSNGKRMRFEDPSPFIKT